MQGIARNPLADAGILGINGGSMLVVALCFAFFPHLPYWGGSEHVIYCAWFDVPRGDVSA
ncbi:hypothetical protein AS030_21495 [Fictibacillus enclensis]|uniref:Uncharacterized protein n=1 Tax=Fictibacillus enclensis TaxID=1017270 RepID=A0A0V8IUI4_9BACL|nr:hypothetical protein AS030_21495 [Fictibacillus enclensis]